MDLIQDLFRTLYNVPELIRYVGLLGLVVIVFAETGLMVGFFLPGDSLLVTAGLFAAKGDLDIVWLNLALMAAAIVGDAVGYWIGWKAGKALYSRPNSFFFRREHLLKTHEFYERHGGKTIIIARFMPIVRTFAPTVAGAAEMTYKHFAFYNVIGGIAWVLSMTLTGYFLGQVFGEALERNIHILVAVVIFLSLLPAIIAWLRERMKTSKPSDGNPAGTVLPRSAAAPAAEPTE
ncbi:MAG TPA: VTT domain-containing protein [Vicinamibacteria bacterium]|nr:VTT domain-containing protein [Vicinamibacteria bacterium]